MPRAVSDIVAESKPQRYEKTGCARKTTSSWASSGRNRVARMRLNRKVLKFRSYLVEKRKKFPFLLPSKFSTWVSITKNRSRKEKQIEVY